MAITRARRHLAVVCDSDTVSNDPFLKSLLDYMNTAGQVWSAHQFVQGKSVWSAHQFVQGKSVWVSTLVCTG